MKQTRTISAYRHLARNALDRAKNELSHNDIHRLRYAALELRMSLEAIIYERSSNYLDELPSQSFSVWQPRKLLKILLEIDPHADKSSTISIGIEEEYGKPAKEMTLLGTDRVLSLSEIKKYYDKLGSYLHTESIDQSSKNKGPKPDGMLKRCNEVIKILDEVISSPVFNSDMRVMSTTTCQECGKAIARRVPDQNKKLIATCIDCVATYDMFSKDDGTISWIARGENINCANQECKKPFYLWEKEIIAGTYWTCTECSGKNSVVLSLQHESKENGKKNQ